MTRHFPAGRWCLPLLLLGCETPEERARSLAVQSRAAGLDVAAYYPFICEDDRAAVSLEEARGLAPADPHRAKDARRQAAGASGHGADANTYAATFHYITKDRATAVVHTVAIVDGAHVDRTTTTLRATRGGSWCVATGWAITNPVVSREKEALGSAIHAAVLLLREGDLEAGRTAVKEARQVMADTTRAEVKERFPSWEFDLAPLEEHIARRTAYQADPWQIGFRALPSERSIGSLHRGFFRRGDPSLGAVSTRALDPADDRFDRRRPASAEPRLSLVVRCQRGNLDILLMMYPTPRQAPDDGLFVSHRASAHFADEPAEQIAVTAAPLDGALFLPAPWDWARRLADHEGSTWTVELQHNDGVPRTLTFGLGSAESAITDVSASCYS